MAQQKGTTTPAMTTAATKAGAAKVTQVRKRDGRIVEFDRHKITNAIFKAAQAVGGHDIVRADQLSQQVAELVNQKFAGRIPSVEDVQDTVEKVLIEQGHAKTAKAFILYRAEHAKKRDAKTALLGGMVDEESNLSLNALTVLERRYLLRNKETGKVIETPTRLFRRVADNIAQADALYGGDVKAASDTFFRMMSTLEFLPNSPTLMNAGTDIQQLSACFVVPVPDSIEGIFTALKDAAIIHKSGGGTGFSFSRLRPKNDVVRSTMGVSSGPISFMMIFDCMTQQIKQGGKRRGANMGILRVDHPDILEFINLKADGKTLSNFNISVAVTDRFMEAVEKDQDYELVNPHNRLVVARLNARAVFDNIVAMAWARGDPGLIFLDEINRKNPCKHMGEIEATNPCGEQPLMPYESCNLGSINLNKCMNADNKFDWETLRRLVHDAVHFLDNVIDMNQFPIQQIETVTRQTRKIGLGLMGFADVLYRMGVPYDSEDGLKWGEQIMKFIHDEADKASAALAAKRGDFPAWEGSEFWKQGKHRRNSTVVTVAPTGTISMMAEASSGLEPNFAICYIKNVMDGTELVYANEWFEAMARKRGFYSEALMREVAKRGSIQGIDDIPGDVKRVFVTALDIAPDWHIRMQAAFQKWCDSSISKTINFPSNATIDDVKKGYMLAWKLGCKGVTVYRDKALESQVMNIATVNKAADASAVSAVQLAEKYRKAAVAGNGNNKCPECGAKLEMKEGCATCPSCGYSKCTIG
jgi:ribonucleoside-diphosphate reductase alpha chain